MNYIKVYVPKYNILEKVSSYNNLQRAYTNDFKQIKPDERLYLYYVNRKYNLILCMG